MKQLIFFLFFSVLTGTVFSQYYFNDIVSTQKTNELLQTYKKNRIRNVTLNSYEPDGSLSDTFEVRNKINSSHTEILTTTKTALQGSSTITSTYNAKGQIEMSVEEENEIVNTIKYLYDTTGNVLEISATSIETQDSVFSTERHVYSYIKGVVSQMTKIKNGTDTTFVVFRKDEAGRVGKEVWLKGSKVLKTIETYYYYYDAKGRLTDVVHKNIYANKLLPETVFTYNEQGFVQSMMNVRAGATGYVTWRYAYNSFGLRTEEKCYTKNNRVMGNIVYDYK
jgi:hypothetical protein